MNKRSQTQDISQVPKQLPLHPPNVNAWIKHAWSLFLHFITLCYRKICWKCPKSHKICCSCFVYHDITSKEREKNKKKTMALRLIKVKTKMLIPGPQCKARKCHVNRLWPRISVPKTTFRQQVNFRIRTMDSVLKQLCI